MMMLNKIKWPIRRNNNLFLTGHLHPASPCRVESKIGKKKFVIRVPIKVLYKACRVEGSIEILIRIFSRPFEEYLLLAQYVTGMAKMLMYKNDDAAIAASQRIQNEEIL